MGSSGTKVQCKNSTFGCIFVSSSAEDMVKHFQSDCAFHPLQCFKCSKMVQKMNFAEHYELCCEDTSASSPCPRQEEFPDAAETKAGGTATSREGHFLRECALCVKSLCRAMEVVAPDVAEVKVMKEKQQDLEVIVKGQGGVIQELSRSISVVVEKVNKVQEDVSGLVKRLEKDVGNIVQRVEEVDGLIKEVRVITHRLADQSEVYWYVENVSQYIEKAKTGLSYVESDVFVVRGYSARLCFEVEKQETGLCIGLYLALCRGPNDSLLQWPFGIPYTLSLIHPTDDFKTKECEIYPYLQPFEKPKNEENRGYGAPDLCCVEEAQEEGFIENDAVCFALTLHE